MKRAFSCSTSALVCLAVWLLGVDQARAETVEQKATTTVLPKLTLAHATPAAALMAVSEAASIHVYYVERQQDKPDISVAWSGISAATALQRLASMADLAVVYRQDGAYVVPDDDKRGRADSSAPPPMALLFAVRRLEEIVHRVANSRREAEAASRIKEGDVAPDFTCRTITGETFSLGQEKGQVVLVNFFATWCGPCMMEMPYLEHEIFQKRRASPGFKMIALGVGQPAAELEKCQKEKGFSFPIAPDLDKKIYAAYGRTSIPKTYLIGRDGRVKLALSGYLAKGIFPACFVWQQEQQLLQALQKELAAVH